MVPLSTSEPAAADAETSREEARASLAQLACLPPYTCNSRGRNWDDAFRSASPDGSWRRAHDTALHAFGSQSTPRIHRDHDGSAHHGTSYIDELRGFDTK